MSIRKRVLFVDDDPVLLRLYRAMLEKEKDQWEAETADNPRRALELLASRHFHVLVSDFSMPGMDGLEFMREVSQAHPRTARVIVSGIQDQEKVARLLEVTHQFLPKPFDFKTFTGTLRRVGELQSYLQDSHLQSIVGRLKTVPSFPALYLEVLEEISREARSLENLAGIVSKDQGMTAKLLQIVNSAAFGRAHRIATVMEAIQYLGVATVQSLVLSTHVFSSFDSSELAGCSLQQLWDHALQTAMLARLVLQVEGVEPDTCEEAYTAGLLHDIGKLLLARSLPTEYRRTMEHAAEQNVPLFEAELQTLGATHAGVGAYLLGLWGLPAAIVEAVAFHHRPALAGSPVLGPLTAVHIANGLVRSKSASRPSSPIDLEYLGSLGLQDGLERWRSQAARLPASSA